MFDDFADVPFDVEEPKEDLDIESELFEDNSHMEGPIDVVTANYYVGLVKKNKQKENAYKEQAKAMKEDFNYRVDNWLRTRQQALEFSTQYYLGKLEAYYRDNQPANGKSLSLPEGHIGFYEVKEKFDFDANKDEIIKTLENTPGMKQYVRYTPAINKTDLRKACSVVDGEVYVGKTLLPGANYTPPSTEFKAR